MRPVMHGDLVAAARVLRALPAPARAAAARRLIAEADAADRYRKQFGRGHSRFGTGSLMVAAGRWPKVAEPGLDDAGYLHCLGVVLAALAARRGGHWAGISSTSLRPFLT